MNKNVKSFLVTFVGLILTILGFVLVKGADSTKGILATLPYICIAIGCGTWGHGMGTLLRNRAFKGDPALEKKMEIERLDERNIMIANAAKAKGFDIMIYVFGALMLTLSLMNKDLNTILLVVFAYLFVIGYSIYYRIKFDKIL
ncbi:DUF6442 family protein [Anaerosporobacter faecicola]|uniref:DUF6442 family protein n=1 Tax=Anaerosporobacter faecicola TaxID=2718714 RepID=UPI00143BEE78|nr:DUF6442 family protein [Anaerosporobacter faecicola]